MASDSLTGVPGGGPRNSVAGPPFHCHLGRFRLLPGPDSSRSRVSLAALGSADFSAACRRLLPQFALLHRPRQQRELELSSGTVPFLALSHCSCLHFFNFLIFFAFIFVVVFVCMFLFCFLVMGVHLWVFCIPFTLNSILLQCSL